MKNITSSILILFGMLLILSSCESGWFSEQEPEKIDLNLKAAEVIEADELFAFELFNEVCQRSEEENIMISPLSVSYALGMAQNGAAGTTLDAIKEVLHFEELSEQEVNESYKDLMDQMVNLDRKVELTISNSIWYREGANVLDDFITTNQDYFNAGVEELDFNDQASVDIINNWIDDNTNGLIKDMLDVIPPGAYMYLVNAIYFNASWKYEFDKKDTKSGTFYKSDSENSEVEFMSRKADYYYTYTSDYEAVELPYGDSTFSMVAILPHQDIAIDTFISDFDQDVWNDRHSYSSTQEVQVYLPKFKYGFKDLLNEPLIDLGMEIAFGDAADFSRITLETQLFISRVIHQSFIDVQEKGTEAAAATIIEFKENATGGMIRFDRPFLYLIKENSTGAILFMGKVENPEYED